MKRSLIVLSLIFLPFFGHSQNILQGDAPRDLELAAREASERWAVELAMSAKQTALMEEKLVEYALKKEALLNSKMREEAKTRRLLELEYAENQAMQDILTRPQYNRYLYILEQEVNGKQPKASTDTTSQKK